MTTTEPMTRTWNGVAIPLPGTFALDPAHTRVGFVARHMMVSKVRGSFKDASGEIVVAEEPTASTVSVTIQAASIDTGVEPGTITCAVRTSSTWRSIPTSLSAAPAWSRPRTVSRLRGDLTIKDVTREVTLDAEFEGLARSPWGQEVIGFTATTEIDREDFGVTWNQVLETGGALVGKKVKIEIELEAIRQG